MTNHQLTSRICSAIKMMSRIPQNESVRFPLRLECRTCRNEMLNNKLTKCTSELCKMISRAYHTMLKLIHCTVKSRVKVYQRWSYMWEYWSRVTIFPTTVGQPFQDHFRRSAPSAKYHGCEFSTSTQGFFSEKVNINIAPPLWSLCSLRRAQIQLSHDASHDAFRTFQDNEHWNYWPRPNQLATCTAYCVQI